MNKKKCFFIILLLSSCVQKPSEILYKDDNKNNRLEPSYIRGSYVKTKDNKVVRDIRVKNNNNDLKESNEYSNSQKSDNKVQSHSFIIVKKGDNLTNLAKNNNMTVEEIAELNNLEKPYNIYYGQKLKVYSNKTDYKIVTVGKGESLLRIAINNGLTLREIATINNINPPYNVYFGQKLKVPFNGKDYSKNYSEKKQEEFVKNYIVKSGDSLYSISKENNITISKIIKDNDLKRPYNIFVGQKLYIKNYEDNNKKIIEKDIQKDTKKDFKKDNKQNKLNNVENIEKKQSYDSDKKFFWPVKGEVVKKFGKQDDGKFYDAINIKAPLGTQVFSSMDGEVAYAGNELKGYGNIIIIKHENGWLSIYGYCDKINVKVKEKVVKGQNIATVGKTGNVDEPQLYFAIRKGRTTLDPLKFLENN